MTDKFDKAQAIEEATRTFAIESTIAASRSPKPTQKSDGICTDCGLAIEPLRHQALPYAQRCIGCQTEVERRQRRG